MTPKELALFPLNLFLLPGEYTQLFIFEERYKQLIAEARDSGMLFGIPFTNKLNSKHYGSLVELVEVLSTNENGEMDIIVQCKSVFILDRFYLQQEDVPYPAGIIRTEKNIYNWPAENALIEQFKSYIINNDSYRNNTIVYEGIGVFEIARELRLNDVEKIDLLNIADQKSANDFLFNYIKYLQLLQQQEKVVFRNMYLT